MLSSPSKKRTLFDAGSAIVQHPSKGWLCTDPKSLSNESKMVQMLDLHDSDGMDYLEMIKRDDQLACFVHL